MSRIKHGMDGTRLYKTWDRMKQRCLIQIIPNTSIMEGVELKYAMNGTIFLRL